MININNPIAKRCTSPQSMHSDQHLKYLLVLLHTFSSTSKIARKLLQNFPNLNAITEEGTIGLQRLGLKEEQIVKLKNPDWRAIDCELEWALKDNQFILAFTDSDYPALLREIYDFPLVLFVKGNKNILHNFQVAVVGSRKPTPIGIENAYSFAKELVEEAKLGITSGLALGIDAAAHRGALFAKGETIAVMGAGLNYIYPRRHTRLAFEILSKGGALISEFPLKVAPLAENFPQRNRIISGLSLGTLVVEASLRSGSLITARFAAEQGREVFAMPSSIRNPLAQGCHHLLRQGAKLVESAQDIIEELPQLEICHDKPNIIRKEGVRNQAVQIEKPNSKESKEHQKVLACIGYEITPVDVIVERSCLTITEITSILLYLELCGYVQKKDGGYIKAC